MNSAINWQAYWQLARLDRPIGSMLLLWPTYWALWLASSGAPDLDLLLIFTLGVLVMRSAGCVINDYADRDFDKHVERTRERPLTAGKVSTREALWLFAALCLLAFLLVLALGMPLVVWLSLPVAEAGACVAAILLTRKIYRKAL